MFEHILDRVVILKPTQTAYQMKSRRSCWISRGLFPWHKHTFRSDLQPCFGWVGWIVPDLHNFGVALVFQPEEKREKKNLIPLSYLCISPARSQSLPDLLSFSHPLLPHISHLLLLYSGRPIRRRVSVCVTNPLRNFTSLLLDKRLNLHYGLKRYFIYIIRKRSKDKILQCIRGRYEKDWNTKNKWPNGSEQLKI